MTTKYVWNEDVQDVEGWCDIHQFGFLGDSVGCPKCLAEEEEAIFQEESKQAGSGIDDDIARETSNS